MLDKGQLRLAKLVNNCSKIQAKIIEGFAIKKFETEESTLNKQLTNQELQETSSNIDYSNLLKLTEQHIITSSLMKKLFKLMQHHFPKFLASMNLEYKARRIGKRFVTSFRLFLRIKISISRNFIFHHFVN